MNRYVAMLMLAYSAVAVGAAGNVSKVNGSIDVGAGEQAGDVSTVNGSISVGEGARARDVETVNGAVRLDPKAEARAVETVNGGVELGEGAVVAEDVSAVNGKLTLGRGARVGGSLENVNGAFRLDGATVGGGIETVNGDVFVGSGSRVEKGIRVGKGNGWFSKKSTRPRVTIESGSTVDGPLYFEREVDLYLGSGAVVGSVEGVAPVRHTLP